jgi:uncharacterized delta-60 repeat protein
MQTSQQFTLLALLMSWQSFGLATGDPGVLDPAFNSSGVVVHEVGGETTSQVSKVFMLEDGSIAAVGGSNTTAAQGWPPPRGGVLVQFASDGEEQISTVYDANVPGCTAWRQFYDGIHLDSGEFIVAGQRQSGCGATPNHFDVVHIRADGVVERYFDPGVFHNYTASGHALALQPDGKVVTAGRASTGSGVENRNIALTRHHIVDGTLDAGFGDGGEVTFDIDGDWDRLNSVAITDNGKIVAAGFATTTNDRDFLILRFEPDGTLDTSFGSGGMVIHDFEGAEDRINDLSLMADGKIMVAGITTAAVDSSRRFTVARFLESGSLDGTFADNGVALIEFGSSGELDASGGAMEIGPDRRIYLTGWMQATENDLNSRAPVLAVLHADGTPDPAFGPPATLDFGSIYPAGIAGSVAVHPTLEFIALGGWVGEYDENGNLESRRIAVARLFGIGDMIFRDRFE